jgi:hypothetical protein
MTKADLDLAHKTAGDLAMYAKYVDQLGHAKLAACVRNASSLLQKMVEEAEAEEMQPKLPLEQLIRDARKAGVGVHLADDTPEGD